MYFFSKILKTFILIIVASFLSCDVIDENLNYVVVTVYATVQITFDDDNDGYPDSVLKNHEVEMSIVKAGGERVEGIGVTDNNNAETSISGVFNLYKEQSIVFMGRSVKFPAVFKKEELLWETVDKWAEGDGKKEARTFSWNPGFGLMIQNKWYKNN